MKKRLDLEDKTECCGCLLCRIACPQKAINIFTDCNGSLYPTIDEKKCVDCGICSSLCNFKKKKCNLKTVEGYAAITKSKDLLNKSTSGGVFSTIARKYLSKGWKICGCIGYFKNEKYIAEHVLTNDYNIVEKMYGSKYVQSSISNALVDIKKGLLTGDKILFSGTPCQISALKGFLKKEYDNLVTIEIICHGTPSQKMFNEYIDYYNKKNNCIITDFAFRTKEYGWNNVGYIKYKKRNSNVIKTKDLFFNESSYYYLFEKGYFFRESCYKCPYAGESRIGDITIGDYWGFDKVHSDLLNKVNIHDGISCIMVNSIKGKRLIDSCGEEFLLFESSTENIKKYNRQLNSPTSRPDDLDKVLEEYNCHGYEAIERFFKKKNKHHNIQVLKNRIKKILKKLKEKSKRR